MLFIRVPGLGRVAAAPDICPRGVVLPVPEELGIIC